MWKCCTNIGPSYAFSYYTTSHMHNSVFLYQIVRKYKKKSFAEMILWTIKQKQSGLAPLTGWKAMKEAVIIYSQNFFQTLSSKFCFSLCFVLFFSIRLQTDITHITYVLQTTGKCPSVYKNLPGKHREKKVSDYLQCAYYVLSQSCFGRQGNNIKKIKWPSRSTLASRETGHQNTEMERNLQTRSSPKYSQLKSWKKKECK